MGEIMRSRRLTAAVLGAAILGMSIGFVSGTFTPGPDRAGVRLSGWAGPTVAGSAQSTRIGPGPS
ncbi:hypothetical protein GCM10018953_66160 [Streptosporangium nondiastaticum]